MINGVFLSEIPMMEESRRNHYRKLSSTVNKTKLSKKYWLSPEVKKASQNRKFYHDNWKMFQRYKLQELRYRDNNHIFDRLHRISASKSRYSHKEDLNSSSTSFLHHNYKYENIRWHKQTEKQNKILGSKILKVHSNLNQKKNIQDFSTHQLNSSRLSKFQIHKKDEPNCEQFTLQKAVQLEEMSD